MNRNLSRIVIAITLTLTVLPAFANSTDGKKPVSQLIIAILCIVIPIALLILDNKAKKHNAALDREEANQALAAKQQMLDVIAKHLPTLAIKHEQTTFKDAYGVWDASQWIKEVDYFVEKVLTGDAVVKSYLGGVDSGDYDKTMAAISRQIAEWSLKQSKGIEVSPSKIDNLKSIVDSNAKKGHERRLDAIKTINNLVSEYRIKESETQAGFSMNVDSLDPIQFERYCVDLLNASGWDARGTQASGDQGVDVIAMHGNVKAVFQCKKYSQAVGNAAVQEIIAGKVFEQAQVGALISNATFTASAKQLAFSTGVFLLHHSELPQFAARLGLVNLPASAA